MDNRIKREVELSPEDILTILTLWENERQRAQPAYHNSWQRFEPTYNFDPDTNENEIEAEEENWLDTPVYPHVSPHSKSVTPNYYYEEKPQIFEKRAQWGGFSDNKKKRFMVARKRNDPTRELRYLTGPVQNRNDFYALSQLLSQQREPNVPLYHRLVL